MNTSKGLYGTYQTSSQPGQYDTEQTASMPNGYPNLFLAYSLDDVATTGNVLMSQREMYWGCLP